MQENQQLLMVSWKWKRLFEGAGTEPETANVSEYRKSNLLGGVSVSLFDSPGLADATEKENDYIEALETICQEVNLVLKWMTIG